MQYQYVAYGSAEGVVKGSIDAPDQHEALAAVSSLGYRVLRLRPARQLPSPEVIFPSLFSVKAKDLITFARQVASMLSSGGTLVRALEMAENESKARLMRRTIRIMRERVSMGEPLSKTLRAQPKIFNQLFVSIVEVGESTGRIGESLEQIADMMEQDAEAKAKAIKTLMYPMVIMGMSFATLAVLMVVAVPPLLKMFDQLGADAPATTRIAVALVNATKANAQTVLIALVATFVALKILRRMPRTARIVDGVMARLPLYGPLTVAGDIARFSRTMAVLLGAGVTVSDAMRLGMGGVKNVLVLDAFRDAEESLLGGQGLTTALRRHSVLPSLFVELMMMGEEGNQLHRMMSDAATAYQKERDARLGAVLGTLEPLSTLVVGGIVAFIAFSMFVPIYSGLDKLG